MPRTVRAAAVLAALVFLPLAGAHAQERVAGTVVDARFRPVEGAVVTVVGRSDSARTLVSAAFILRAFSALPKSVSGSFLNGVVGTRSVGREVSSTVAIK